jgi:hypothetical protein
VSARLQVELGAGVAPAMESVTHAGIGLLDILQQLDAIAGRFSFSMGDVVRHLVDSSPISAACCVGLRSSSPIAGRPWPRPWSESPIRCEG